MVKVSVTGKLVGLAGAIEFAKLLADYLANGTQHECFGSFGGFERNYDAMAANIRKIHIKLPGEPPWVSHLPLSKRTSNNFLIFAQHIYDDDYYQILAVISPNAHQVVDTMLPDLVVLAEKFIEIGKHELDKLQHYS